MTRVHTDHLTKVIRAAKSVVFSPNSYTVQRVFLDTIENSDYLSVMNCIDKIEKFNEPGLVDILKAMKVCLDTLDLTEDFRKRFVEISQAILKHVTGYVDTYNTLITDIIGNEQIVGSVKPKKKSSKKKTATKRITTDRDISGYAVRLPVDNAGTVRNKILKDEQAIQEFLEERCSSAEDMFDMIKSGCLSVYELREVIVLAELNVKVKLLK